MGREWAGHNKQISQEEESKPEYIKGAHAEMNNNDQKEIRERHRRQGDVFIKVCRESPRKLRSYACDLL